MWWASSGPPYGWPKALPARLVPRVRGTVRVALRPGTALDGPALLAHVAAQLRAAGCQVRTEEDGNRVVLESGTPDRYSPLAFVDGGTLVLGTINGVPVLRYDLGAAGGLTLCLVLSPVCGLVSWFTLGDPALTTFAVLAPVVWLFGANYVLACVRAPDLLTRLIHGAPGGGRA